MLHPRKLTSVLFMVSLGRIPSGAPFVRFCADFYAFNIHPGSLVFTVNSLKRLFRGIAANEMVIHVLRLFLMVDIDTTVICRLPDIDRYCGVTT